MKPGDLKGIALQALNNLGKAKVREILVEVERLADKKYAYTTIATILTRLEKEGIIRSEKNNGKIKSVKFYSLNQSAHKNEVNSFLKSLYTKFGMVGVKHLGDVLNADLTEEDLDKIRKKLY